MDLFEREFNELIVETFHLILKEEMIFVKSLTSCDVSAREIHLMEHIAKRGGQAILSDIAEALQITLASVTVMVNKLEGQGYVLKTRDATDARAYRLSLTPKGQLIDDQHTEFHRQMVQRILEGLTEFERVILGSAVRKLNNFFDH